MATDTLVETQEALQIRMLSESLRETLAENETLSYRMEERLARLDNMLADEVGWSSIGATADDGPSLSQLQKRSKQIREAMTLSPHLRNGSELLANRCWSDMPRYDNVPGLNGVAFGRGVPDIGKYVNDPVNVRYVFGTNARRERSRSEFSDGVYLLLGDNSTRRCHPLAFSEITADYRNPDNRAEIWAYRRSWNRWNSLTVRDEPMVRWYFTDLFYDKRVESINYNGALEAVDNTQTIIDGFVNTQVGWAFGFPDAGTVIEWARKYSEFIRSGLKMSEAMARLWAQYTPSTPGGASAAGVKVAGMEGFGNTSIGTGALTPLSTAGKSYDFAAGIQVLAIVAAGLGVSVISLSANPGDAGGSYGAAQTLSLPERLATMARRNLEAEYDTRVLKWMGAKDPKVSFASVLDGAELYRLGQAAQLSWNSGLYGPEEAKGRFEQGWGNSGDFGDAPTGVMIPNNEFSAARTDVDPNGASFVPTQAGGAGQGQSNGSGGQNTNDSRTDTIVP